MVKLLGYFYPPTAYIPRTYPSYDTFTADCESWMAAIHSIWPVRVMNAPRLMQILVVGPQHTVSSIM